MKTFVRAAAAGAVVASGMVMSATPAEALSADCSVRKERQAHIGFDYYRAVVSCDYIGSGTKVRARLDINGDWDSHSSWFITEGKSYYTSWRSCAFGCTAEYQLGSR